MPIVFNPGEAETRPLDPSAIVYTTAQKVADFLSIGPQDAVLVSADSTTNTVFVTGADYRTIGFESGDTIVVDNLARWCKETGYDSGQVHHVKNKGYYSKSLGRFKNITRCKDIIKVELVNE